MLKKELPLVIAKTYFWSDSTSVLLSIYNSNKRFPVFVADRLAEIERNSDIESWRYVPSMLNPADEATRCKQAKAFVESSMFGIVPALLSTKCCPCNPSFEGLADKNLMVQGHGYMVDEEHCPVKLGHTFCGLEMACGLGLSFCKKNVSSCLI